MLEICCIKFQVKSRPKNLRFFSRHSIDMDKKRSCLASLVAIGQLQKCCGQTFKGKTITADIVDTMPVTDIDELYARYRGKMGALMTRAQGQNIVSLYVAMASALLPIPPENGEMLKADLATDPFLEQALTSSCCELYYRYGMYLAPVTTALTTVRYGRLGIEQKFRYR